MIVAKQVDREHFGRTLYAVDGMNVRVNHFSVRRATREHAFRNHRHAQEELWFVIDGEGMAFENGVEYAIKEGDLVHIPPMVEHGATTASELVFVCLG